MTEENKVTEVNEVNEVKVKKSKKPLVIVLLFAILIGGIYGVYEWTENSRPEGYIAGTKKDTGSGRETIKFDITLEEELEASKDNATTINREPYINSSLHGGQVTWDQNTNGHPIDSYKDLEPKGGKLGWFFGGSSLRHPDDEEVNPDEEFAFDEFWSAVYGIDSLENKKLNKTEVEEVAKKAVTYAESEQNPAAIYIGDLILNLKDKKPTTQSIYYLMIANRINPSSISEETGYDDYEQYLDRSYTGESQEKSVVDSYTDNFEQINKNMGLVHIFSNGSKTKYSNEDGAIGYSEWYAASNRTDEVKEGVMVLGHYKDISNYMLAEYFVGNGNQGQKVDAKGLREHDMSYYKSAFTWCISPKIEEIASAYYDIVEPQVYKGTFENRKEAYEATEKAFKGKYSLEEVKSAVMTYEFWALQP